MGIFSAILAFFFSITSFFTVLLGDNLCTISMVYNEDRGLVWECDIADDSVAIVKSESARGSVQSFVIEGISEGRTEITMTNKDGDTTSCIVESIEQLNPYNGKHEYYFILVAYDFGTYISYDEGITLTAETPVDGGYWDFGFDADEPELKTSMPETVNGVCTFEVINPYMDDVKYGTLFTYYSADGTPLENKFVAYTLKADGTIEYINENRLTKIELPSDFSKLIFWNVTSDYSAEEAEIISIYTTSENYGSMYFPEDFVSEENRVIIDQLVEEMLGKVPVGGTDTVVIEALKEGTAEFTLEKVDMYPLVKTDDGYEINTERYEVLETITIAVTVDADLNITYEIK